MSHTVAIKMIADQEIEIREKKINIHDIEAIIVNADGIIVDVFLEPEHGEIYKGWLSEREV